MNHKIIIVSKVSDIHYFHIFYQPTNHINCQHGVIMHLKTEFQAQYSQISLKD
jgi:hypothetical protein